MTLANRTAGKVAHLPKRLENIEQLAADYHELRAERKRIDVAMEMAKEQIRKAMGNRREYRSTTWTVLRVPQIQSHLDKEKLEMVLGDLEPYYRYIECEQLRVSSMGVPARTLADAPAPR